ncbi:hypothetical protein [Sphingopyxis witflariensis]|nr:hypothetical protein [Sphingopyxis witflariensis]
MTEQTKAVKHPNVLAIRARIAAMLAGSDADRQLAEFAEKLVGVIAGEPNELTDRIRRELDEETAEPWRHDPRIEALECMHAELGSLIDEMAAAKYASLPQEVRAADDAARAEARERRAAMRAA